MPDTLQTNRSSTDSLNISYYDEIADSYDQILNEEKSNRVVRATVRAMVASFLKPGQSVLDFGGGTGIDLEWLSRSGFRVIFCEPSVKMRERAIDFSTRLQIGNITFLGTPKTDFSTWDKQLPFNETVDAILANFGVINCISNIELLFTNLALVVKPGGHFIAIVLNRPLRKMWSWHRRNAVTSLLFGMPFIMYVHYKGHKQTVFVHSTKQIKKASADSFTYVSHECIPGSGFTLIHLMRK